MLQKEEVQHSIKKIEELKKEISKAVIGQEEIVDSIIRGMLSNGHILIEGLPGIAKTLLARTFAKATGTKFERIQFTPDLLPADIIGIVAYDPKKGFYTVEGPIFTDLLLADEINRCSPKTQSALLEAMQERQVTIGKKTFQLPKTFFVIATQNPLELLGTYPLPEAQIDRFLFKLIMQYPSFNDELAILKNNIELMNLDDFKIKKVLNQEDIIKLQNITKKIYLDPKIENYILNIVGATRHKDHTKITSSKYIRVGASPRASIALYISSKANALLSGKTFVTPFDVKTVAHDVLRHRIIINYEGQAENITSEKIIDEILSKIQVP